MLMIQSNWYYLYLMRKLLLMAWHGMASMWNTLSSLEKVSLLYFFPFFASFLNKFATFTQPHTTSFCFLLSMFVSVLLLVIIIKITKVCPMSNIFFFMLYLHILYLLIFLFFCSFCFVSGVLFFIFGSFFSLCHKEDIRMLCFLHLKDGYVDMDRLYFSFKPDIHNVTVLQIQNVLFIIIIIIIVIKSIYCISNAFSFYMLLMKTKIRRKL